jgi:hypothetical protein
MMLLARISQGLQQMAEGNPTIAPGLAKAVEGINEAQSALVTQPAPQPMGETPPY